MADFDKLVEQIAAERAAKAAATAPTPAVPKSPEKPPQAKPASTRRQPPAKDTPTAVAEPAANRPGRKPSADSKRTGWIARTFYVQPETAVRLKRHVMRCQLEGRGVADQSEAVDQALQAWLDQAERSG